MLRNATARVAAPSIRSALLASCWPRPHQRLPVSATGGGRRCCSYRGEALAFRKASPLRQRLPSVGATTTTAASGGNRESLLGQRPARRKRSAADAGCRNPALSSVSETERLIHSTEPASIFIVKDLSGKNHVLLLHLNEKLQKIPSGAV